MKRILFGICLLGILAYTNLAYCAARSESIIYKGNQIVWGMIYVSSFSISPTAFVSGVPSNGDQTTAFIPSTTYQGKTEVTLWGDKGGANIYVGSIASMNTSRMTDCVRLYPGESICTNGKSTDSIFVRTLAGAGLGTTVYYIISYEDK